MASLFGRRRRSLTASVSIVEKNSGATVAVSRRSRDADWQREAWAFFHDLGEIRFSARYVGNSLSRVRFYVGTRERPGDPVEPIPDDAPKEDLAARDVLDRLRGRDGTFASLVRVYGVQQFVAGESFLVGTDGLEGETWEFLSTSELRALDRAGGYHRIERDGTESPITDESLVLRFWQRDPEFRMSADSPMRPVLDLCESLRTAHAMQTAGDRSRLASAGVAFIPAEADMPKAPSGDQASPRLQLVDDLLESMTTAMTDPGSAASVVPILVEMKGEFIDRVKHMTFARDIDMTIAERIDHLIRRLAQGLDLPPEKLLGTAGVNHWGAWQIAEETITGHIAPLAAAFGEDLTAGFVRPTLETAALVDPARYAIGFDVSDLFSAPNPIEHALDLYDRFLLAGEATVLTLGFSEDQMPSDEEIAERMEREAAMQPAAPAPEPAPESDESGGTGEPDDGAERTPPEAEQPDAGPPE